MGGGVTTIVKRLALRARRTAKKTPFYGRVGVLHAAAGCIGGVSDDG